MELANTFTVPLSADEAWSLLTDIERIAPCMPGARLIAIEGDEYRGTVRVKVGPVTVEYNGTARFVELDESARRAVLKASGRETRGQGNATATVSAVLVPDEDGTRVEVRTDLDITGRVAQFGRGMLADVSTRLLGQFVDRLEHDVLGAADGAEGTAQDAPAAGNSATSASGTATALATEHQHGVAKDEVLVFSDLLGTRGVRRVLARVTSALLGVMLLIRRRLSRGGER